MDKHEAPGNIDKTMFQGNTIARKELHSMAEAKELEKALQRGITRPRFPPSTWNVSWDTVAIVNGLEVNLSITAY